MFLLLLLLLFYISICISTLPTQHTTFIIISCRVYHRVIKAIHTKNDKVFTFVQQTDLSLYSSVRIQIAIDLDRSQISLTSVRDGPREIRVGVWE